MPRIEGYALQIVMKSGVQVEVEAGPDLRIVQEGGRLVELSGSAYNPGYKELLFVDVREVAAVIASTYAEPEEEEEEPEEEQETEEAGATVAEHLTIIEDQDQEQAAAAAEPDQEQEPADPEAQAAIAEARRMLER